MPRLVADEVAKQLRQRIDAGEWAAMGRMPPERQLADEYGIARNTMRRAVSLLEDDGIVTRQVGRGTFLANPETNSFAAIIGRIQGTSPADLMELRLLLEPAAASAAATAASDTQLEAIELAHKNACEAEDMPTFEDWDAVFHQRIFDCTRNELLKETHNLLRLLRSQPLWFDMKKRAFSEERMRHYCKEHEALLDALMRRDREAARNAMTVHLKTVQHNLLG
ncbi:FadR family transcriptional regulator [Pelagibius litoralis]|uniref:FadR family transcriptional regulator n=1 Tax=Pelagibius litoralis TaxID=374515 RepID=A0A967EXV9_9PROT|nr:FCD domain-containing protein [Pelagibius litoralis]NIA69426.1 FadR family transcriptional regulator [Pelagibius litoralis]